LWDVGERNLSPGCERGQQPFLMSLERTGIVGTYVTRLALKCASLVLWWRWRESNPRPKSSTKDIYKLSRLLLLPGEPPPTALHPG
jgi:hypothetical protein